MENRTLIIAPHADDEVLGMGGTIARRIAEGVAVHVAILTGEGTEPHPLWPGKVWEDVRKECVAALEELGCEPPIFRNLPAACLDVVPAHQINAEIRAVLEEIRPDELYVPYAFDLHKDHGAIAYGAAVATRPYLQSLWGLRRILAYETLSETHLAWPYHTPPFQPNVFVDVSSTLETKIRALKAYGSQIQPDTQPRSEAALRALATLRGTHIGVAAAEGFVLLGEYQR